ncbi:ganglioside-induced differentiation-associated protein 1-like isoform X2 [Ptychodera flava]
MAETIMPWYMRLNSLGQVPTLVYGDVVLTQSERIIEYLDEKFPETTRLCPDKSTAEGHRCEYFKQLCNKVNPVVLTMGGSTIYTEISGSENSVWYFSPSTVRLTRKAFRDLIPAKCEKYATENPDLKGVYLKKAAWGRGWTLEPNVDELQTMLHLTDDVFTKLEIEIARNAESASHDGKPMWLCGDNFTVADIYLSVLLHRLEELGLHNRYWGNDKRPQVAKYFNQIRNWDSYKKSRPTLTRVSLALSIIRPKLPWILAVGATAAALGIGIGYALSKGSQGSTFQDYVPFTFTEDKIWVWRFCYPRHA